MWILEVVVLSLGVSIDALAVSVTGALADRHGNWRFNAFWAGLYFGAFQFFMPLLGFYAGDYLSKYVSAYDHWLAFLLLGMVGYKMIHESFELDETKIVKRDFFNHKRLPVLALATSLDALAVGASIAFSGKTILFPAAMMGAATAVISAAGVVVGTKFGHLAGENLMLRIGGIVIVLIGLRIALGG